ncbi:MAG: sulfatase-like hydrolase/transferase [Flavisolibacter sp.]
MIDLKEPLWRQAYFLVLLPLFFVLHGFIENFVSVTFGEVLKLFFSYLLAAALLYIVFYFYFKRPSKTAIYVFLLLGFYLFFGAIHDSAKKIAGETFLVKYVFILPFILVFFITAAILIKKSKSGFSKTVHYLNLLMVILVAVDLVFLAMAASKERQKPPLAMGLQLCDSCAKPDVFLIVADEYAGTRELKEDFGFDNSAFENALRQRGFHVLSEPRSNYNFTPFSVASMLKMDYLTNIEGRNRSKEDMNICFDLINRNPVWNFFLQHGYQIKNNSIFHVDDIPTSNPQNLIVMGTKLITSQTFLSRFNRDIRFNLVTRFKIKSEIRRITYYQQESNEKIIKSLKDFAQASTGKPKLVYTHLLMPHYPYYFDRNGKPMPLEFLLKDENNHNKAAYIEYLHYSNQKFLEMIDAIIKNAKQPPVIIFMSDHGFREYSKGYDPAYHFMNFNSVLLPNRNYSGFYEGMTNVNQFRTILNSQFGQRMPMLKDSMSLLVD